MRQKIQPQLLFSLFQTRQTHAHFHTFDLFFKRSLITSEHLPCFVERHTSSSTITMWIFEGNWGIWGMAAEGMWLFWLVAQVHLIYSTAGMELFKSGLVGTCGITIPERLDRSSAANVDCESSLLLILSTSLDEAPSWSGAPDSLELLQTCLESRNTGWSLAKIQYCLLWGAWSLYAEYESFPLAHLVLLLPDLISKVVGTDST